MLDEIFFFKERLSLFLLKTQCNISLCKENCYARFCETKFNEGTQVQTYKNDLCKVVISQFDLSSICKEQICNFIINALNILKFAKVTLTNSWNTIFLKFTFQNSGKHRFLKYSFCTFCCFSKFCFCIFAFYEIWENENCDFLKILKFKKWNLQI